MIELCGLVVGLGGGELILEISDGGSLAIRADLGDPAFFPAVPGDAFVSGGAGLSDSSGVAIILGAGGRADIGLSVVQAVMIDVVRHHTGRDLHYLAVHVNGDTASVSAERGVALGVEGVAVFGDVPFVLVQSLVIFGIHDGEFALGQAYPAKGVAVAKPTIEKHGKD